MKPARPHSALFFIASLALFSPGIVSQFCEPLYDNSWSALKDAISINYPFVMLCPFHIKGENCPSPEELDDGFHVQPNDDLYIMCESFFAPMGDDGDDTQRCIIECPGRHFTVSNGAALTLDGMDLRGSTDSAVRVKDGGRLSAYYSTFQGNTNGAGNGGAIHAGRDSHISVAFTQFKENSALNGGAIYNLGSTTSKTCNFKGNDASNGSGGAIFSGTESMTVIHENHFISNTASFFGPSVFDGAFDASLESGNTGCDNGSGQGICNGVFDFGNTKCRHYTYECHLPTPIPSSPPMQEPTDTPTKAPIRYVKVAIRGISSSADNLGLESESLDVDSPTSYPSGIETIAPVAEEPSISPSYYPSLDYTS